MNARKWSTCKRYVRLSVLVFGLSKWSEIDLIDIVFCEKLNAKSDKKKEKKKRKKEKIVCCSLQYAIMVFPGQTYLLSCQPRVTVMSCFAYKVIRGLESIYHLSINYIQRIGLIHK